MDLRPLLENCLAIALDAGEAIMQVYASDFAVTHKNDETPLTQADLAAHHLILTRLAGLDPQLPALSEEGAETPYSIRRHWQKYWLVDPLDGTLEFVKRNGDFTVNIALIESGLPVLGVVYAPASGVAYFAARGVGAFRMEQGHRVAICTRTTPARPRLVIIRSHADPDLEYLLRGAPEHDSTSRGSSLKLCLVAEGAADLYPRTGPTSEWDTGAGQCVAEVAGAAVFTLPNWGPLRYNEKDSLLNPGFVVVGDTAYGWRERLQAARIP